MLGVPRLSVVNNKYIPTDFGNGFKRRKKIAKPAREWKAGGGLGGGRRGARLDAMGREMAGRAGRPPGIAAGGRYAAGPRPPLTSELQRRASVPLAERRTSETLILRHFMAEPADDRLPGVAQAENLRPVFDIAAVDGLAADLQHGSNIA